MEMGLLFQSFTTLLSKCQPRVSLEDLSGKGYDASSCACWCGSASWVVGLRASVLFSMLIRVLPQFFAGWVSPTDYSLHESMQAMNALERISQQDSVKILCNIIREVTSHHLFHIPWVRSKFLSQSTPKRRGLGKDTPGNRDY